ncbi:hypothetical protein [Micromonospora inyonensis]|uniref:Uncharacterized protein n=1 Tax=Micromonospora inyonensis TaxID=47866 RepID=A0A1C6SS07_9ACTN|nr:hypothetical protein [Micromonospora inyonensis]SCL20471.1 hypothetical protein GA0074694_3048 [Micromonospora inyonensis]SCL25453.1 hypothetical protein GA0074694_4225 [Micromonospora inyonensis]SCL32240.1 hypothetical protein GA0074694_6205 [Micromonospora inyonensis]
MRRRGDGERPVMPAWLLAQGVPAADTRAWCAQNGYRVLDVLFARRDAHRARWGVDAAA